VTFNTHNKGDLSSGFARVFTNGTVTAEAMFLHPGFTGTARTTAATSRSVSIPVSVGATASQNTGVAILANSAGNITLALSDSTGTSISGGSRSIDVAAGQQIVGFVRDLLPTVTATQFSGTLTVTASSGTVSALALQFNGALAPVTVTALP
ncbi:MAG: hypothetical protein HY646_18510, partial [Acidobacteria bacterium]|nr:hypothetical protein [Acidobacteriota bacterium]